MTGLGVAACLAGCGDRHAGRAPGAYEILGGGERWSRVAEAFTQVARGAGYPVGGAGPVTTITITGLPALAAAELNAAESPLHGTTPLARLADEVEVVLVPRDSGLATFDAFGARLRADPTGTPLAGGPQGAPRPSAVRAHRPRARRRHPAGGLHRLPRHLRGRRRAARRPRRRRDGPARRLAPVHRPGPGPGAGRVLCRAVPRAGRAQPAGARGPGGLRELVRRRRARRHAAGEPGGGHRHVRGGDRLARLAAYLPGGRLDADPAG
ncbi:hypothetical protein ACFSTC_18155 [Nonomuraea ferruginea]